MKFFYLLMLVIIALSFLLVPIGMIALSAFIWSTSKLAGTGLFMVSVFYIQLSGMAIARLIRTFEEILNGE